MRRRTVIRLAGAAAASVLMGRTGESGAAALRMSPDDRRARRRIGASLPQARLLWVGGGRIYHTRLDHWDPRALTPEGVKADRPRWSPAGERIVYGQGREIWVMDADFSHRRRLLRNAHTADWTGDGKGVTAIVGGGYQVVLHDLGDGGTRVIFDARRAPGNGQPVSQAAELHPRGRYLLMFRERPGHASFVVDLRRGRILANEQMKRGDCAPSWSFDGREIFSTARTADRPIVAAPFDFESGAIGPSKFLVGLDSLFRYYAYDARVSADGHWVVFDGKVLIGGAMWGRREIYIWRRGAPQAERVRLTFDDEDDWTPSLYIPVHQISRS
ncbi:MAG: hypothetical protein WB783_17930 [Arenicellales bacterium]